MGARRARAHIVVRSCALSFAARRVVRDANASTRKRVDGRAREGGRESESSASAVKGGHRRDRAGGDGVGGGGARETRLTRLL